MNPLHCGEDLKCLLKVYKMSSGSLKRDILERIVYIEKKTKVLIPIYKQLYTRLYLVANKSSPRCRLGERWFKTRILILIAIWRSFGSRFIFRCVHSGHWYIDTESVRNIAAPRWHRTIYSIYKEWFRAVVCERNVWAVRSKWQPECGLDALTALDNDWLHGVSRTVCKGP